MITTKPGVLFGYGVSPEILRAIASAGEIFAREGLPCVITSLRDGRHMTGSYHYSGEAVDLRTKHLPNSVAKHRVVDAIRAVLGSDYDVLLEHEGELNEHVHIEHDPREDPVP